MLKTDITSNLAPIAADLRSIPERADAKLRAINTRAARQLLAVARSVVHVQSGRLRDSLRVEGPFDVISGSFEARIVSNVPYADIEAARDGAHDFASRTIADGQGVIDGAAADMERALIVLIEEIG